MSAKHNILSAEDISVGYGKISVLDGISIDLPEDEILTVIGPNGTGKTTLMLTLAGILSPSTGEIRYKGDDITATSTDKRVKQGICLIPEERNLFRSMTVRENLILGGYTASKNERTERLEMVFDLFPRLAERKSQTAGTLSGGESQMLTIGRGLMAEPEVLILDEPSLGLAPKLIPEMFDTVEEINDRGISIILAEQEIRRSLEIANKGCLIENGQIVQYGDAEEMAEDESIIEKYMGGLQ